MPIIPTLSAAALGLAAVLLCVPAGAQRSALKRVTLSSLTAQGFEIKAAIRARSRCRKAPTSTGAICDWPTPAL
jgi:hypothetical protein